jgi:hypothetical protein
MSEMTTEILEQNLGKIVLVRLKGGKSLRGRLKGFDQAPKPRSWRRLKIQQTLKTRRSLA